MGLIGAIIIVVMILLAIIFWPVNDLDDDKLDQGSTYDE